MKDLKKMEAKFEVKRDQRVWKIEKASRPWNNDGQL